MINYDFNKIKSVHFIGVGGISMSGLATFCIKQGKKVSGSDINLNSKTIELEKMGAKIIVGHFKDNVLDKDLVVFTSAISNENIELISAYENCPIVVSRSEFLGAILKLYKKTIAISGSHGKTTTTAMIGRILLKAGFSPTIFLGGEDLEFSNYLDGDKNFAVVEACEYKRNFLNISPYISVVLNIDNDHMDCYKDIIDVKNTFKSFIKNGISLINADDNNCKEISLFTSASYGIKSPAVYTAKNVKKKGESYSFTFYAYQKKMGRINLKIPGEYNVNNALACCAVCDMLKVDFKHIKLGLESFSNVLRRAEKLGKYKKAEIFADYAHHPKEIKAVCSSLANAKTLIVFQPHTYSRTKFLMQDFVRVLSSLQNVIIYKTYPAREEFSFEGCAKTLYNNLNKIKDDVFYADNKEELMKILDEKQYSRIIFMGAGDIYDIAKFIAKG